MEEEELKAIKEMWEAFDFTKKEEGYKIELSENQISSLQKVASFVKHTRDNSKVAFEWFICFILFYFLILLF